MVPRTKTALVELAVASPSGRAPCCSPTGAIPTIPPGSAGSGAARPAAARPGRRLGAGMGGGPLGRTSRPCTSTPFESLRLPRRRRLRERGALRAGDRRRNRARRLRRSDVRRARPGELSRDCGRQGGRRRDVLDVQDLRHGRLATHGFVLGNAEIVGRVDLLEDHARAGIFAAVEEAGIAAHPGPRTPCRSRSLATRRGETAWSKCSAAPACRRPSRKGASMPGSSCRTE